ncbi:MAG: peptide ABC transporter substrate-binding protein [Clostridiaceae bacterium]|nr:peptide ABC transporter substrate-binding protein [Clostridiaceae bacterium]
MGILLVMLIILALFTGACRDQPPGQQTPKNTPTSSAQQTEITVHVGPEPDIIDPALNSAVDGATLLIHAFEGLMTLDQNGTPIYGQAESCEQSDDGLTYTFKLREGLKWSDGKPLTAQDFVWSWKRAVSPDTAADYEYMFESIEGYAEGNLNVTAPDDRTVVVKLVAPTPYFLELCAFPTFFPVRQDVVEAEPDTWTLNPSTYIGNGPYMLQEWAHDSHMIFTKNPNYWNASAITGPDKLRFLLMSDDNAILAAFQNGEILFADSMPNDEIDAWRDKPEFNLEGQLGTYYISFNVQKAPLNNPLVRKALVLAVDRDYIVTNIGKAGQQPAGAYVPTGLSDANPVMEFRDVGGDYYDPSRQGYQANLEAAKKALADAGYPNGEGLGTIEYLYNEGTGHQLVGEALQAMWKDIGVNITLISQEWNTFLNTRKNGEYQIARNGWLGDYNDPISFLDMWVTGSGNNDAQWSNKEYDAIIAQVKASSDKNERMQLMHQAEDTIFDEWMLCPIYYYVDIFLKSQKLQGFYSSPLGYKYFMYSTVQQ